VININYAHPFVDWETQSILGLLKPCLERAAAGRWWVEEGQEKGFTIFFFKCISRLNGLFFCGEHLGFLKEDQNLTNGTNFASELATIFSVCISIVYMVIAD
jgi:hypothetical protein